MAVYQAIAWICHLTRRYRPVIDESGIPEASKKVEPYSTQISSMVKGRSTRAWCFSMKKGSLLTKR